MHSAKEPAYRVQNDLTQRFQQDWSVLATHSTGRHRNSRRNGGLANHGVSLVSAGQIDLDYSNIDPFVESCVVCDEQECYDQKHVRPPTIEISLADVPMRVRKPKQRT